MREIKFRVWWPHLRKMRYFGEPIIILDSKERCGMFLSVDPAEGTVFFGESIPMQFTGLRDKNGREIYEGDILRVGYLRTNEDGQEEWEYPSIHVVEWGDKWEYPAFDLYPDLDVDCNNLSYVMNSGDLECEIIGNIYENPELLPEGR